MPRKFKRKLEKRYYLNETSLPKTFPGSALTTLPISIPLAILPNEIDDDESSLCLEVSIPFSSLPDRDKLESLIISIPVQYCRSIKSISLLRGRIFNDQLPGGWVVFPGPEQELKLLHFDKADSDIPNVVIKVSSTLEYTVSIEGHTPVIPDSWNISLKKIYDYESFRNLLEKLSKMLICVGNTDETFIEMCIHRKGVLYNNTGII